MQPIPEDILKQFNAVLDQKMIPPSTQNDYRKWLLYYLDFRAKYPPPDSRSEQVRLFVEKVRSKGKSEKSLQQAAQALSLFFQSQGKNSRTVAQTEKVPEILASLPAVRKPSAAAVPQGPAAPGTVVVGRVTGRGGGRLGSGLKRELRNRQVLRFDICRKCIAGLQSEQRHGQLSFLTILYVSS